MVILIFSLPQRFRHIRLSLIFCFVAIEIAFVIKTCKHTRTHSTEEKVLTGRSLLVAGLVSDESEDGGACQALARRLEDELRAAKSAQLACGEVLLPADLLPRIARDVLRMAENEPCGLR